MRSMVVRVVRLPWAAELPEEVGQVAIDIAEGDVRAVPADPPAQCVQHEQRLVGGALIPAAPDAKLVELP